MPISQALGNNAKNMDLNKNSLEGMFITVASLF
jgi:hypothetical protein